MLKTAATVVLLVGEIAAAPCTDTSTEECTCDTRTCSGDQHCSRLTPGGACLSSTKVIVNNVIPEEMHSAVGCDHGLRLSTKKPTSFQPISCADIRYADFDSESLTVTSQDVKIVRDYTEYPTVYEDGLCILDLHGIGHTGFQTGSSLVSSIKDDTLGYSSKFVSSQGYCVSPMSDRSIDMKKSISREEFIDICESFCYAADYGAFLLEYRNDDEYKATCRCSDNAFDDLDCMRYNYNWKNSMYHTMFQIDRNPGSSFKQSTEDIARYLYCPLISCGAGRLESVCSCGSQICETGEICHNGECLSCNNCAFCHVGFNTYDCECANQACKAGRYCTKGGECKTFTDSEDKHVIRSAYFS